LRGNVGGISPTSGARGRGGPWGFSPMSAKRQPREGLMKALSKEEERFIIRAEKNIKNLPVIFSFLVVAGLVFSLQGILSANTTYKVFGLPAFSFLYSLLWIAYVFVVILNFLGQKKWVRIIKKLRTENPRKIKKRPRI
jgi:hypothetical protein